MDDHKTNTLMASSSHTNNNKASASAAAAMAIATAEKEQHQQPPLKCPRCDSSNTKFCYYNNYSLSQPRHFCKACKRYWTRGGTLRNVPVGGGCRKNKRHKRHSDSSSSSSAAAQSHTDLHHPPPSNHVPNPNLFYGLSSNPHELNFPFSSFRVSSEDGGGGGGFDLHPQINGFGFSSPNGFKPIQEASSSPFSANNNSNNNSNSIFFGSSTPSTMASLLASTQKFSAAAFSSYEDPQMPGMDNKQVKAEGDSRVQGWNPNPNSNPNPNLSPLDQVDPASSSSLVWNTSNMGAWFDPSTVGSSVPSLI